MRVFRRYGSRDVASSQLAAAGCGQLRGSRDGTTDADVAFRWVGADRDLSYSGSAAQLGGLGSEAPVCTSTAATICPMDGRGA